jgi:hypothetical protein
MKFESSKRMINLVLIYLLAYFTVHILYLFMKFSAAYYIGIENIIMYFSYVFYDTSSFEQWSRLRVSLLYGFPTLIFFVFTFIFWLLKDKLSYGSNPKLKLYLLWSMLISAAFFIADFVSAPFERQGVAIVAEWFYISKEVMLVVSILFLLLIPLLGWYLSMSFIKLANSRRYLMTKWTRVSFLANNIFLSFFYGSLILTALLLFNQAYTFEDFMAIDFMRMVVIALLLFFVMLFNLNKKYIGVKQNKDLDYFNLSFFIFSTVSLTCVYIVLAIS